MASKPPYYELDKIADLSDEDIFLLAQLDDDYIQIDDDEPVPADLISKESSHGLSISIQVDHKSVNSNIESIVRNLALKANYLSLGFERYLGTLIESSQTSQNATVLESPEQALQTTPIITVLVNDFYQIPHYYGKQTTIDGNQISPDTYGHGELIADGTSIDDVGIYSYNYRSQELGLAAINPAQTNVEHNLQAPFLKGNLSNMDIGNIMILPQDHYDSNEDGIIDDLIAEKDNPAGEITLAFDQPIYSFGLDVFNLEYGPSLNNMKLVFTDRNGSIREVPFSEFINEHSIHYDDTLLFGSHSANRIDPIDFDDLQLGGVNYVKIILAEGVGVDNFSYTFEKQNFDPAVLTGNVLSNDQLNADDVLTMISLTFDEPSKAQDYVANNPQLDAQQEGAIVHIPVNGVVTIPSELGGSIDITPHGDFTYHAPAQSVANETEIIQYQVNGSNGQYNASLNIEVIENTPQAVSDRYWVATNSGERNYNLVFILDVSGSMVTTIDGKKRLDIAKETLISVIDDYNLYFDDLKITIIPFGSGGGLSGAFAYHAMSIDDAKDFILKEGAHTQTGVDIHMVNPNTGGVLGSGTFYDTALFYAQQSLLQDISDTQLSDFAHRVYFISDGQPSFGHEAISQELWPENWLSWQDFIHDPFQDGSRTIQTYAIGIDPLESLIAALLPVATDNSHILEPAPDLHDFEELLSDTLPQAVSGNLLNNDLVGSDAVVVSIDGFELPQDGSMITWQTSLGGTMWAINNGSFAYLPPFSAVEVTEPMQYIIEQHGVQTQADLTVTIEPIEIDVTHLYSHDSPLTTQGLHGVVTMDGQRSSDVFTIDMSNTDITLVYLNDIASNSNNELHFINTFDVNQDGVLNINDIIDTLEQTEVNGLVHAHLVNNSELIFNNIGTLTAFTPDALLQQLSDYNVVTEFL